MKNKNFEISISFFSLQGPPALLMPWMVFTIVFLVANTVLYIVYAVRYFEMGYTVNGDGCMIVAVIYICK